jgi:transposase InsO family protein
MSFSTTKEIDDLLKKLYYDPVTGYTGINPLIAAAADSKKLKRRVITEWLTKQKSYTLHRPARINFERNKTLSKGIDYVWQSDLVDIQPLSKENSGFRYLLVVIDTFSRYAWVEPLKSKSGQEVVRGFREIFKSSVGRKPQKVCTDMGKEYLNKELQQFFNTNNIIHYSLASDTKASLAERFNRTLKELMWRYFTANKTRHYVDILPKLVEGYNRRKHRSIGIAPIKVNKSNEQQIWNKQFAADDETLQKQPKFKVGQTVRLSSKKGVFEKGYTGNWTKEIFTVGAVRKNQRQYLYDIIDPIDGETIKGGFYDYQLQLVKDDDNNDA